MPQLREVSLSRGQSLFEPGDNADLIYFPSSACISVVEVMQDGKVFETATIGRESAAGLLDAMARTAAVTRTFVQIAGSATTLPSAALRARLTESPSLSQLCFRHLRATTRQAEVAVACNLAHDAHARLARWLLMTEDRTGSATFPLTQDYMAVMTGVQRTTVSVMAASLKKAGFIDYRRGNMVIVDQEGLKAQACECYGLMEAEFAALRTRAT